MSGNVAVLAIALGCSAVVIVIGAGLLRLLLSRSLTLAISLVAVTSTASVLAAAIGTSEAMFLSPHDLHVLLLLLIPSAVVACLAAAMLGRRVAAATQSLVNAAARLGTNNPAAPTSDPPNAGRELAVLHRQLADAQARIDDGLARERTLEESRRELVGWVSHDLRTPLAGVRAMTEALEDGVVDDPVAVASYHRRIGQEVDRLSVMVDDLFELSRVQSAALSLTLSSVTVQDLVHDVVGSLDPVARAARVHLEGDATGGPPLLVDVAGVRRVLANLAVNAIRHTPDDGTVAVTGGVDDAGAWVEVRDACGGLDEADLSRVFDVGWRGSEARTPSRDPVAGPGAGLGLAIARGIVQAHDGQIDVRNAGAGCCFRVTLPLRS